VAYGAPFPCEPHHFSASNCLLQGRQAREPGDKYMALAKALKLSFAVERIKRTGNDGGWRWMSVEEGRNRYRALIEDVVAEAVARKAAKKMMFVFIWLVAAFLVGLFASVRRNRSGFGWFVLALLFSPLLTGIILAILKEADDGIAVAPAAHVDFEDLPPAEQVRLMKFRMDLASRKK
jgi:hypothetical protein